MAVSDCGDAEPGGQVDEAVSVDVEDIAPACLLPDEAREAGPEGVDSGSLRNPEAFRESAGTGAGRVGEGAGEKVASGEAGNGA